LVEGLLVLELLGAMGSGGKKPQEIPRNTVKICGNCEKYSKMRG